MRVARAAEFRATRDMEQVASLFAVKEDVDTLKDDFKGAQSAMEFNKLLAPYVGNSINRIDDLNKDVAATKSKVDSISSAVDTKVTALAKQLGDDAKKRADDMDKKLALLTAANDKLKKDLEAAQSKASTDLEKMVDAKLKTADEKTTKALAVVSSAMSSKRGIWIGGTTHTYRRGWRDFEYNRLEVDSAAPFFTRRSNTRFRASKTGIYKMIFEGITHGGWCHNHAEWRVANKQVAGTAHWYTPGTWQTSHYETTVVIKAGQDFWFRIYGCNYATHSASQNNINAHNKIFIEYMGEVSDKCSGPFCKGV